MSKLEVDAIEPQSGTTLTIGASGDTVNIASGATITDFTSTGIDDNATSTAITIDSSEQVAIGISGAFAAKTHIEGGDGFSLDIDDIVTLKLADITNGAGDGNYGAVLGLTSAGNSQTLHAGMGSVQTGVDSNQIGLFFFTNNGTVSNNLEEAMRINNAGNVLIGKTAVSNTTQGITLGQDGQLNCVIAAAGGASQAIFINRQDADGTLIVFRQANATEGSISVSGATVSYNGFTGSHWSRFIDESKPDVLRGTVLESLDQMTDWYNLEFIDSKNNKQKEPYALKANDKEGDIITYDWNTKKQDEEGNDIIDQVQATIVKEVDVKHVMSKISDTSEAKNVYGVFSHWDNDDLINNDFYVASVGSYVVRIKVGQTVSKGDLLQSNGDGTAKVQADDIIRASTFAKVLSNTVIETYEDGSYLVPCSLMC
jgi:hypothetical protein